MRRVITVILYILSCVVLIPVAGTVIMSFVVDGKLSIKAWKDLLFDCIVFYPMFWNTLLYALMIAALSLIVAVPEAFGIRLLKNRFSSSVSWLYMFLMMLPLQVTLLPVYIQMRDMHLLDTRACIILPEVFGTTGTVLMMQYMKSFDTSIVEAARLETSSVISIIIHIVVPEVRACVGMVFLINFVNAYSLLEQPLLYLEDQRLKNLTVFISQADKYTGNVMFPASVIYMIPVLLLYLLLNQINILDVIRHKREAGQ